MFEDETNNTNTSRKGIKWGEDIFKKVEHKIQAHLPLSKKTPISEAHRRAIANRIARKKRAKRKVMNMSGLELEKTE